MQVILHIGYPKTGSSAIQSHISCNRGWLHKRGLYVPSTGYTAGAGHAFLLGQYLGDPVDPGEYISKQMELLRKELHAAQQAGFDRALVSWEGFALVKQDSLSTFAERLHDYKTTLLAYVREQGELHQSAVLQHMGRLRFGPGDPLASTPPASLPSHYRFHSALGAWDKAFKGQLEIKTRLFDRQRLTENNVVLDFLHWIGAPADEGFCLQQHPVNNSLDVRSAALLHTVFANKQNKPQLMLLAQALGRVINEHGAGSRSFLDSAARETIWSRYETSNEHFFETFTPENALEGETGFPLPKSSYPGHAAEESVDSDDKTSSEIEFYRHLRAALNNPVTPVWEGNILAGFLLITLTSAPNTGWQKVDNTGTWSAGKRSTLNFHIPECHQVNGPRALALAVNGQYANNNTSTRVTCGPKAMSADLTQAKITIELDEQLLSSGIQITLEHQDPQPAKNAAKDTGAAFKLQMLGYNFVWD